MAVCKKYKTLKGLLNQSGSQVSLENIKSGRFYHKTLGHVNFVLPDDVVESIYIEVAKCIGGNYTKVLPAVRYATSHWSFSRFTYCEYQCQFTYTAGQDQPSEMRTIRKDLIN